MENFDPVALGWLTQADLGYLFALAGVVCAGLIAYAILSNV